MTICEAITKAGLDAIVAPESEPRAIAPVAAQVEAEPEQPEAAPSKGKKSRQDKE